jgi:hypothetical protein
MNHKWQWGNYTISTDQAKLDLEMIHHFLTTSYWAQDISLLFSRRQLRSSI